MEEIESRIRSLEADLRKYRENPSPNLIEKTTEILLQKLDDRDRIIDLELRNLSQAIKLDIQQSLKESHLALEQKIESQIRGVIDNQRNKVSWGLEVLRIAIVSIMFILSIKMVGLE